MRIALFTETFLPKVDGIVTRLCHTVRHLTARGNSVLIVAPRGGPAAVCTGTGLRDPGDAAASVSRVEAGRPWPGHR
jgi:hypothetical protein